jgi:hypothetical protein
MVTNATQRYETGTQRRCTLRHRLRFCCGAAGTGLLILLMARPAGASIITFSDNTFNPSDWSLTTQTKGAGGDASAVQKSSGGNPAAYRQVTVDVIGRSDSQVYAFNLKNGATVAPASTGAIISLTYSEDRNTTGQEFGPAILQGSNLYYAYAGSGGTSGWQSTTMTFTPGATTNNLLTSFGTDISSSAHPDFSAIGAPITFGFVAIDNSNASSFTAISGYDNWAIGVTTNSSVPEPAGIGILVLTSLALMRRPTSNCVRFSADHSPRSAGSHELPRRNGGWNHAVS